MPDVEVTPQGPLRRSWLLVAVPLSLVTRVRPTPDLLRGTARAFARSGRRGRADRWARRYLATLPTDPEDIRGLGQTLDAAGGATPGTARQLGRALLASGDAEGAAAALARATSARPRKAKWWDELGRAYLRVPGVGHRYDPTHGLTPRQVGDPVRAAGAFSRAVELSPDEPRFRRRLAAALMEQGEADAAAIALASVPELEPQRAASHYQRGTAILRCGAFRDLSAEERQDARRCFERTLALDAGHRPARKRLVRATIEDGRWVEAWRVALGPSRIGDEPGLSDRVEALLGGGPTPGEDVQALLDELAGTQASGPAPDWWLPLHCRLLHDGWFGAAYDLKQRVAASLVASRTDDPDPQIVAEVARALVHLDDVEGARAHLDGADRDVLEPEHVVWLDKVASDVRFLLGDPSAAIEQRAAGDRANLPEATERFVELIEGREVAVVGPADTGQPTGVEIDGFDTVIRTSHGTFSGDVAAMLGTRTDVAYYASTSSGLLAAEIRDAIDSGGLQQAVFRPSSYRGDVLHLREPGDLRYVPSEFKAGFHGGPMAIQRILYDVLRYRPRRVKLFNVDLFVGEHEYGAAYEPGTRVRDRWRNVGVAAARALAHDYLLDLRLTRSLHDHGLIEADPVATRVLALHDADYLARLDERAGVHPAGSISGEGP